MRILNLKDASRQYSKFSLPGFRSGSIIKKLIACIYYFLAVGCFVTSIFFTVSAGITNFTDLILSIVVISIIFLIFVAPVVVIGFSDYYDWHGIKLFLIILVSWCVLLTAANYFSSLFSDEFIKSSNPDKTYTQITSDANVMSDSSETEVDSDIIIDNIAESDAQGLSAGK